MPEASWGGGTGYSYVELLRSNGDYLLVQHHAYAACAHEEIRYDRYRGLPVAATESQLVRYQALLRWHTVQVNRRHECHG